MADGLSIAVSLYKSESDSLGYVLPPRLDSSVPTLCNCRRDAVPGSLPAHCNDSLKDKKARMIHEPSVVNSPQSPDQQSRTSPTAQLSSGGVLSRLVALFVNPSQFFASFHELARPPLLLLATLCLGIASMVDRIEQHLLRAEMGEAVSGWAELSPWLLHSWSTLWVVLVVLGAVNVPLFWYLGGWWYRLRLKWSGATALDPPPATTPLRLFLPRVCPPGGSGHAG